MTYEPNDGDYIEVVVRGNANSSGTHLISGEGVNTHWLHLSIPGIESIKKIEEPLKVGDLCWFWDNLKYRGKMEILVKIKSFGYPYITHSNAWANAEKVPEPAASQLKELYFDSE